MDEYLFQTLAKLNADRLALPCNDPTPITSPQVTGRRATWPLRNARSHRIPTLPSEVSTMKIIAGLTASLIVNAVALGWLHWELQQPLPRGEVFVMQLPSSPGVDFAPTHARLASRPMLERHL